MKHTSIAVLLNALTLVGGHFYNRRWDRGILFFVILVLWGIGVYAHMWWRIATIASAHDVGAMSGTMTSHWNALGIGVVVLWAVGLVVVFLDSRGAAAATSYRWTASGVIGAVGLSVFSGAFLATQVASLAATVYFTSGSRSATRASTVTSFRFESSRISQFVYLGTSPDVGFNPPKPPSGNGHLRGRFTYDGKPASGVKLKLVLNKKYETAQLTTDANGGFTVRLPEGEWVVNRLDVHGWVNLPKEGRFMIVTGTEPKLLDTEYNEHYWIDREGTKVVVGDRVTEPQLNFIIRKRVAVTWPKADPKPTPTTLAKGAITWDPYPGADKYFVRINEVRHESDSSTAYYPVAKRVTKAARFPLVKLAAAPGDDQMEYEVSVFAFADDGTLLSKSNAGFEDNTFVLTDKQQLASDEERGFLHGRPGADELQKIRNNNRRIDAIEVLLKDDLVDEAVQVLGKINGVVDPGKKMAITGYVKAKLGQCAAANKLFAKALAEGGRRCVPDYYRAGCPK